jgi:hypothetical protein
MIMERHKALGDRYDAMVLALKMIFGKAPLRADLTEYALKMAREKKIHLDRASARVKEGLICWLCENCPNLLSNCLTRQTTAVSPSQACPPFDSDEEDSRDGKLRFD